MRCQFLPQHSILHKWLTVINTRSWQTYSYADRTKITLTNEILNSFQIEVTKGFWGISICLSFGPPICYIMTLEGKELLRSMLTNIIK